MADHPASYLLEELAAGGRDEATALHVEQCGACRSYVERLRRGATDFAETSLPPLQFADAVAKRSTKSDRRAWYGLAAGACLAAAAAGAFLLVRPPVPSNGPVAMATSPETAEPTGVRFKGRPQIVVIREREGSQERLGADVGLRAWDRLRVEISVDDAATFEVGVLSEDGAWVTLLPPTMLTPGTHLTPQSVRFDDAPTAGWVLAGAPDAVDVARRTRSFEAVTVLPLHVERGK